MRPLPLGSTKCICCNDEEVFTNIETRTMTRMQLNAFLAWYDRAIGTEREVNNVGIDEYYVVCFEVDLAEVMKVKVRCEGMS
jgi:hypothetical protein